MEIPSYPAAVPLTIAHKALLDELFAGLQPKISELTFANLYLFRAAHNYGLTMVEDALVVLGKGYDGRAYFLPPVSGAVQDAVDRLLDDGLTLYGADEGFVRPYLQRADLEVVADRDNFDYLYLRSDLAELPGNRYHKKKNRINYFANRHSFSVEPYGDNYRPGALALLDEWHRVHSQTDSSSSYSLELDAAREALLLVEKLGLQGLIVLMEGKVKAFVLGEKLNDDTSVCHFQKADPFLDGLYQLADREFNRLLFTECTYVNREQDLGEANLRESKLSYHPLELVQKFRVSLKDGRR
ncbi:phosphatidylglycerol lysyltransferase domain-containing protein [Geotalea sp. SG265]|uniref:DUF2156 domain-containing protein n=1 Tax=Geotalea sp. SG265 TaxID=2922867 RepID=UPI001FAEE753|nr:phosphatidylglycerol lysyltransferase domain-containing protein [Geotalea sp. SG265]